MKKKVIFLFVIGIFLLGLCGCHKIEGNTNEETFESFREKINCPSLSDIKFSNRIELDYLYGGFLTNSGEYYYLGKFSDGTNCRKVELDSKIVRFVHSEGETYLLDEQNNVYSYSSYEYNNIKLVTDYSGIAAWRARDMIDDSNALKGNDGMVPGTDEATYILKDDGVIYLYNYPHQELNKIFIENEKILDFSSGPEFINWIKTDKAMYLGQVKDQRCFEYDDIECEYEYVKNEALTSRYDEIAFVDRFGWALLKDGSIYTDIK